MCDDEVRSRRDLTGAANSVINESPTFGSLTLNDAELSGGGNDGGDVYDIETGKIKEGALAKHKREKLTEPRELYWEGAQFNEAPMGVREIGLAAGRDRFCYLWTASDDFAMLDKCLQKLDSD